MAAAAAATELFNGAPVLVAVLVLVLPALFPSSSSLDTNAWAAARAKEVEAVPFAPPAASVCAGRGAHKSCWFSTCWSSWPAGASDGADAGVLRFRPPLRERLGRRSTAMMVAVKGGLSLFII